MVSSSNGLAPAVSPPDREDLQQLLRTGPFADALRAAIKARGLGLARIQERMTALGASVSSATISYWQSGRSRPERRDSLIALAHLESVLELEQGSLSALLGPPRPRGRWLSKVPHNRAMAAWWPDAGTVDDALDGVDTRWDERLSRISQHDLVMVGPDREELSIVSRQVLRAETNGPDRWVAIMHLDEHDRPLPLVQPRRHCRLGRVVKRDRKSVV